MGEPPVFSQIRNIQVVTNKTANKSQIQTATTNTTTDSYTMRLLEGVCESFPQIVLLLAYFIVTIVDSDSLSISEPGEPYTYDHLFSNLPFIPSIPYFVSLKSTIFFILNILYSVFSLLFSLVNTVNITKGGQLKITQKAILVLVYFFSY